LRVAGHDVFEGGIAVVFLAFFDSQIGVVRSLVHLDVQLGSTELTPVAAPDEAT